MVRVITIAFALVFGTLLLSDLAHADGAAVYAKCKGCHGADGKGNAAMATGMKVDAAALDLTKAATKAKSDADLEIMVKDGRGGKMPAFGAKLSADQIKEVVKFIKGL